MFPLIRVKTTYGNRKPWLTDAVNSSIKLKNKLDMKNVKNKTVYNENTYKQYHKILSNKEIFDKVSAQAPYTLKPYTPGTRRCGTVYRILNEC